MSNFVTIEHLPWMHADYGNNREIADYIANKSTSEKAIIFFVETESIKCKKSQKSIPDDLKNWHPLSLLKNKNDFKPHSVIYVGVPCMKKFPFHYISTNSQIKIFLNKEKDLQNIVILKGYKKFHKYDDLHKDNAYGFISMLLKIEKKLEKDLTNMSMWEIFQQILRLKSEKQIKILIPNFGGLIRYLDSYSKLKVNSEDFNEVIKFRGEFDFKEYDKLIIQYREIQTLYNIDQFFNSNLKKFQKLFSSFKSNNFYQLFKKHFSVYLIFGAAHTFNDDYFANSKIRIKISKIRNLLDDCINLERQKNRRISLRKSWKRYNDNDDTQRIDWNHFFKAYCNLNVWRKTIKRNKQGKRDFEQLSKTSLDKLDCVKYNCAVLFKISYKTKKISDIQYTGMGRLKKQCFYRFTELGCHILPTSVFQRNFKSIFVFDFKELSFLIQNIKQISKEDADRSDLNFVPAKKIVERCYEIFKNNPNLAKYNFNDLGLLAVRIDCWLKHLN